MHDRLKCCSSDRCNLKWKRVFLVATLFSFRSGFRSRPRGMTLAYDSSEVLTPRLRDKPTTGYTTAVGPTGNIKYLYTWCSWLSNHLYNLSELQLASLEIPLNWLRPMTLTFNSMWAMIMTHTHARGQSQGSVGSKDRVEINGRT